MSSLDDIRLHPTCWTSPLCGARAIVDEGRLEDWIRSGMLCDCCAGIEMAPISARVYAPVYEALLAGAALGGRRR